MNRNDLRTDMVVELKNRFIATVMKDTLIGDYIVGEKVFVSLNAYTKDLRYNAIHDIEDCKYSIVKVYKKIYLPNHKDSSKHVGLELLWAREVNDSDEYLDFQKHLKCFASFRTD